MSKKVVSIAEGTWKTGTFVPRTGMYAVLHPEHRLPAEVTLVQGELFPRCQACETPVAFALRRRLDNRLSSMAHSRIHLYQLPVLDQHGRAS
jgi:hypothetical protein